MDQAEGTPDSGRTRELAIGSPAADAIHCETYRTVRKIVIAVSLGALGLALLVKYLVTGTVVRDGLGWALLVLQVVLVVVVPMIIFRRRSGSAS